MLWALVGLYSMVVILLHIPAVQSFIGSEAAALLSEKFGTKVSVGRVDLGFLNRIIVDDVRIKDQKGLPLLTASRVSAKFDVIGLSRGEVAISSAQLFGLHADIYKENAESKPNFQFVIDSLASKNPKSESKLKLRISSLVIRHGHLAYDRWDIPKSNFFSTSHLRLENISGHLLLNTYTPDSLNLIVKRLGFREQSGLELTSLSLHLIANKREATLTNLSLKLPSSSLSVPRVYATYKFDGKKLLHSSLQYEGKIAPSIISAVDLKSLWPKAGQISLPLSLNLAFRGTSTTLAVKSLSLEQSAHLSLKAAGSLSNWQTKPRWAATIHRLQLSQEGMNELMTTLNVKSTKALPQLNFTGEAGGYDKDFSLKGRLQTSLGDANIMAGLQHNHFTTHLETPGLNLGSLLGGAGIGFVAANIDADGNLRQGKPVDIQATGKVSRLDYQGYSYRNISLDGKLSNIRNSFRSFDFNGRAAIDDPNLQAEVDGNLTSPIDASRVSLSRFTAEIKHLNLSALKQSSSKGRTFSGMVMADFRGNTINNATGTLQLQNLVMTPAPTEEDQSQYILPEVHLTATNTASGHLLHLDSEVGHATLEGHFDYSTLPASVARVIAARVPALKNLIPALADMDLKAKSPNSFSLAARIDDAEWLRRLLSIPIYIKDGSASIQTTVDDRNRKIDLTASVPSFNYSGTDYTGLYAKVTSFSDSLTASISGQRLTSNGRPGLLARVSALAANDHLLSTLTFSDRSSIHPTQGSITARTEFFRNNGVTSARLRFQPSVIQIDSTNWSLHPSTVTYKKKYIAINNFSISHGGQHLQVNGLVTDNPKDSLLVELRDIDVAYVLNLINFDDVSFGGKASGTATLANLYSKPKAQARLQIANFSFEDGLLGNMQANVAWNDHEQQIDINTRAIDHITRTDPSLLPKTGITTVNGYVSPKRSDIHLNIGLNNSRMGFVGALCDSFMDFFDVTATGNILLDGKLNHMQLTGNAIAEGRFNLSPLNTVYTMNDAHVKLVPNMIGFDNAIVRDRNGNTAVVTGGIPHQALHNLGYDIRINTKNFLCLDTHGFGDDTFYGTAYADGNAHIYGNGDEVTIDVNATPQAGSFIAYNAASPGSVAEQDFIHWTVRNQEDSTTTTSEAPKAPVITNIPADLHLNIVANCNPNATLKVLTDATTGDFITLEGDGIIRANYFNKGSFQLYGNYIVDHGIYRLTIQNAIRREFQFQQGGTIAFGGDPYDAAINLPALYTVNGVSLSDLNIGRSFTSGNTKVNCLMNITGTPGHPTVDFSLDMPTVNNDVKQMVLNLINSKEEMNQQALYLLAVGRFYTQGSNNQEAEGTARQTQTSLAMQSLLSGTLSQQINTVLSSVINNANWNFGANISTGDEGFNNAEYEGLLNGRMLNNRLLFNGQFGYRDNANATSTFIGDFDLQYLLQPNGNFAIKVYNQTNDRYFTRNSLTTQGIGLIIKKDFNSFRDLFRRPSSKKQ